MSTYPIINHGIHIAKKNHGECIGTYDDCGKPILPGDTYIVLYFVDSNRGTVIASKLHVECLSFDIKSDVKKYFDKNNVPVFLKKDGLYHLTGQTMEDYE